MYCLKNENKSQNKNVLLATTYVHQHPVTESDEIFVSFLKERVHSKSH